VAGGKAEARTKQATEPVQHHGPSQNTAMAEEASQEPNKPERKKTTTTHGSIQNQKGPKGHQHSQRMRQWHKTVK
jgi:hypothetical protein